MLSSFAKSGACIILALSLSGYAQDDPKTRIKTIRDLAKGGVPDLPKITPYLSDADSVVRVEAVKAITDIGTQASLDPLVKALSDNDPEVQIRAIDGIVNFYVPGYIKTGMTASLRRAGTSIKGHFTDTNDQVIDPYIQVRPDVIEGLGKVARGGSNMDSRADAARALGILRGRAAIPDLVQALHSKDDDVIYESLIALQKIRDPSAGPQIAFLVHDLKPRVQIAAIDTLGLLQDRSAIPQIRDVLDRTHDAKVRRSALASLAMMPDPQTHGVFLAHLIDHDDDMRAAAAEGLARSKQEQDAAQIHTSYIGEPKTKSKLAEAFALVNLGNRDSDQQAPLYYLITQLDSRSYHDVAQAYLIELARDPAVRSALYPYIQRGNATKDEKIGFARVLGASGGPDSVPYLETLSKDSDTDVEQEGVRALRNLHARVG